MKKKILSLILSAAMVATATIVPVSAADVKDFADVAANSWYYDSVKFVAERDYMNGTSATTFSPDNNMTRAMFVTVMARVAGAQTDNSATTEFTDVPSGQWYTGAVQWGVEKGLVQGHGDGTFGTNDPITRQDTAVLAERFLKWYSEATGLTPETGSKVDSFTDASSISDYAKDSVEYCRQIGLLTGYEDGSFKPLKSITRAEAATILKRMTFLAEGVLTVTYTDENGKTVMMEVKEGDTFTVDPNGGKITYDGKTYDAEFTITVGTASLTLPAPTRSGYTFKGWKVTEAADGTPAFTAQWASSGGGGGGSSVVTETRTYKVIIDAAKGTDYLSPSWSSSEYNIKFDGDNPISGDVTLVQLAEDMVDNAKSDGVIIKIKNKLKGSSFVNDSYKVIDVTVATIKANEIVEVESITVDDATVDNDFIEAVVNVLSNNDITSVDAFEKACQDDTKIAGRVEDAKKVVGEIADELIRIVNDGDIYDFIDSDTKKLLDTLGIKQEDLESWVTDYANTLTVISGGTVGPVSEMVSGVVIKTNLVDVLKSQYGANGTGAENRISQALEAAGVSEGKITDILNEVTVKDFIDACDPDNFFETDTNGDYYLLTEDGYVSALKDVISTANEARKALCTGEKPLLSEENIKSFIEKSLDKVIEYVDDTSVTDELERIKNKSGELAELFVETEPTLMDLLEKLNRVDGGSKSISFNLDNTRVDSIIDKIFSKIGVEQDKVNNEIISEIKNKLIGNYKFVITVEVK